MKFHNQRSFMGHEISNVNNKPLLHKKGKQWIVVAVSALILAGFGGMVSTTTHADTINAQLTTTKVAPEPANTSSAKPATSKATQPNTKNIGQQAISLHKNLVNNSINNLNNNPKPKINALGLGTPTPINPLRDNSNIKARGKWTNSTATWTLDNQGDLVVHGNGIDGSVLNHSSDNGHDLAEELGLVGNKATTQSVKTLSFDGKVSAPNDAHRLFDDEEFDNNGTNLKSYDFTNLYQIDLSGLNMSNTHTYWAMFGGLKGLTNVIGFKDLPTDADVQWLFCDDPSLATVDLSQAVNIPNDYWMFLNDPKLQSIILGPGMQIDKNAFINNPSSNNTSENVPASQQNWTGLNGQTININNPKNHLSDDTWASGNTPVTVTEKLRYINIENGNQVLANNAYNDSNNKDKNDGYITGAYGSFPNIDWNKFGTSAGANVNNNVPYNWGVVQPNSDLKFKLNNGTQNIYIRPNQVTDTVNYMNGNTKVGSTTISGDDNGATGADNTSFTFKKDATPTGSSANGYNLSNYYIPNDQNIQYDQASHTVSVVHKVSQKINYQWDNRSVGSYTFSGYPGQSETITGQGLQSGWNINPGTYNTNSQGIFSIPNNTSNNIITMGVKPTTTTDTINYQYPNGHNISSKAFTGTNYLVNYSNGVKATKSLVQNTTVTNNDINNGTPKGYSVENPNESFNYDGKTHPVAITPITRSKDYVEYNYGTHHWNNGSNISYVTPAGPDHNTGLPNSTFTISNNYNPGLPLGFTVVSGDGIGANNLTFNREDSSHQVSIEPIQQKDTINFVDSQNNKTVSTTTTAGNDYRTGINGTSTVTIPTGYQLAKDQSTTVNNDGTTHSITITPNQKTDTIDYIANYPNGSTLVSSASSAGNDYQAQGATNTQFTVTSAPANYQLVPNENNTFNYDGDSHDVAVEPAQNNQKTDVINYMNGDVKVASDVYTGNDMYAPNANHTSYNANDYVPAGYHVVNDGGNTFYFDGQTHDVTVYPNRITLEFNNGQAGSKQIDNLKGTTYQINSSDVPANYQLTNPSDNVIDLGDLGKSTEYNVNVSPIQQSVMPSDNIQPAPYVPSTPISVASSASSVAYVPASSASTISKPSNEAMPSHYRYAKVITPLQLHTSKHFTSKNGVLTIKHPTSFRIMRIVRDHKYTRYEVRYNHKNYFITANPKFTINDYVQKGDFKSRKHMMVRVITPLIEYKRSHFSKKYAIKVFKKGAVLPVKRVLPFGRGAMTRFQLTNGRYVTSNKLFVKVIK